MNNPQMVNTKSGDFLFRWRSYLPLLLILIILPGMDQRIYFEDSFYHYGYEILCLFVSLFGLLVRIITVGFVPSGTSGRNTKRQVADSLNTTGIYATTRNPLYLGNYFTMLGIIMLSGSWSTVLIFSLAFWLYYERIIQAEERFLHEQFGEKFMDYINSVPVFIPRLSRWTKPGMPFSLKTVLRREYSSFFAIMSSLWAMGLLGDLFTTGELVADPFWTPLVIFSAVIYITLRSLKKYTSVLDVQGR